MRAVRVAILAFLAAAQSATAVQAERLDWSAVLEGRAGYGTNPYLNYRGNAGSALVGFTVAPTLSLRGDTATTELAGSYNRDQYFRRYGHADNYDIELRRTQQLGSELTGNARVGYFSSISGLFSSARGGGVAIDPGAIDALAVGTRERRVYGDAGLDWQPNSRDAFGITAFAQHETYSRFGGDYDYYGATGRYSRAIDARTRVGVQLTGSVTKSRDFPDSTSYEPSVTLQRTLSAYWTFNGSAGAIIQSRHLNGRSRTSVSPGFTASLCGTYPRTTVCVSGSRQSAPSVLGGLRRETQFSTDITYKLNARSRLIGTGTYGISTDGNDVPVAGVRYGNQRYALARLRYEHDLSRRLSAGVSGSYEARSGRGLPNIHAAAVTANITARLGRLAS